MAALQSNLALRVASAAVLGPIAVAAAYFGGWPFALFWAVAAIAVAWEWTRMVSGPAWIMSGIVYAAAMFIAPVLLRNDQTFGLLSIVLLFAIVWSTDIFGYFGGRSIGGPKLMPAVSPKKTWSGAMCGTLGAMIVAVMVAKQFGSFNAVAIAGVALLLSVCSQVGDLFESWIKRKFNVKDSSQLIPGHGGAMDRLDGFWAAAVIGCLIGLARGGFDAPASGLLVW